MSKYIYNNTGSEKVYVGKTIDPDTYYTIQPNLEISFANSNEVLSDLSLGDIIVSKTTDSSGHITDLNKAINYLKNKPYDTDSDGAIHSRFKAASAGWTYQAKGIQIVTADEGSIINNDHLGNAIADCTLSFLDVNGDPVTGESEVATNATATILDFEPSYDYEIIGGQVDSLEALTGDLNVWVIGVPDLAAEYGGSKKMINNINIRYLTDNRVETDGRAAKRLNYSGAPYHTNKLRFILKHAAGSQASIQILLELYKQ